MSERKFSVGDRVRIVGFTHLPTYVGYETVITAGPFMLEGVEAYDIDLPPIETDGCIHSAVAAKHLVPVYDGNERTIWSDCVWQPKQVSA